MADVPLREYIESVIDERHKRVEERFMALDRALHKAEAANEARLALLNEFRQQSVDAEARFASGKETDDRLKRLELFQGRMAAYFASLTIGMTVLMILVNLAMQFFER